MSRKPVILWFRNDLRLSDHAALVAASRSGAPVIPLYILDDNLPGRWAPGGASRWWLAKSLAALADDLAKRGAKLILRRGETAAELPRIVAETGATGVYLTAVGLAGGCFENPKTCARRPEKLMRSIRHSGESSAMVSPRRSRCPHLSALSRWQRCRNPIASQIGISFRPSRTGRAWQKLGAW